MGTLGAVAQASPTLTYRVGLDENGLGARLGPMLVTGVLAEVSGPGQRWLTRKLPATLARDLDDSKSLASFKDATIAEAWARVLVPSAENPRDILRAVSAESEGQLRARCPRSTEPQCWQFCDDAFVADSALVERIAKHLLRLEARGVRVLAVKSELLCTKRLNDEKAKGGNRFVSDLHAMERLILAFRKRAEAPLLVHCGKVGGMSNYERYFGPLSGRLHTTLLQQPAKSAYHFPGLGEIHFEKDVDARNPLVMLASLVGKYLREVSMARIWRYYAHDDDRIEPASGYHDPVTARLVRLSAPVRRKQHIESTCFERVGQA